MGKAEEKKSEIDRDSPFWRELRKLEREADRIAAPSVAASLRDWAGLLDEERRRQEVPTKKN